eukprot:4066112-Amphidinium_carterae.2
MRLQRCVTTKRSKNIVLSLLLAGKRIMPRDATCSQPPSRRAIPAALRGVQRHLTVVGSSQQKKPTGPNQLMHFVSPLRISVLASQRVLPPPERNAQRKACVLEPVAFKTGTATARPSNEEPCHTAVRNTKKQLHLTT